MISSNTARLFATSVYLSIVGVFSTTASLWVLSNGVPGRALVWITWLSVLGAFVALPTSLALVRRWEWALIRRRA